MRQSVLYLLIALLSGCASAPLLSERPDDPDFAPVPTQLLMPPQLQGGSIYNANYGLQLFGDKNARRVGDIITVNLNERTSSKKNAKTSTEKTDGMTLGAPTLGAFGTTTLTDLSASANATRSFEGSGGTNQSNSLNGSIAVTVAQVLPNGILKVRGEKWLTLTTGKEYIRLTGLLRPEDIQLDNSVSSQKLADARITYSGTGEIAQANAQGWLSRFFSSRYWPF